MHDLSSAERYQRLIDHAIEFAMIVLDPQGIILEWSAGAERLLGWTAAEAVGQPAAMIFTQEDQETGAARAELHTALALGMAADVRWHVRKDGSTVFCDGMLNKIHDTDGTTLLGFGKVLRQAYVMPDGACRPRDPAIADDRSFLAGVLESVENGIVACDRQGRLTFFNEAAQRIHGLRELPLSFDQWAGNYHLYAEDGVTPLAVEQVPLYRALKGERVEREPITVIAADGAYHKVQVTGRAIRDGSGQVLGALIAMHDITDRKRDEDALRDVRLRLEATLSAGEIASWIWDMRSDSIRADPNLARLFGIPEDEANGAPLARYIAAIHPDDLDEMQRQIAEAVRTGQPYRTSYRVVGPDGGARWVIARGRIERDEHGEPTLLAGVTLDITEQKAFQDAWRATEERYRTLITSMDEAFGIVQVLVDVDGKPVDYRFEEVNRALEEQSGLVNAAGRTIREMVPDIEPHWIEIYGRVALTRQPARFEEHSQAMGYWWDVFATPIGDPAERRIAILFTDITARKRAEENLRQVAADLSEANRRKTEFLATLAHELRNPLAPMRTGLDLMRMSGRSAQPGGKVLDMMDRQLRQMVHLIDDLMDVSRINSGKIVLKKECVDLKDIVAGAVETVLPAIEAAHHRMTVDLPAGAMMVDADPTRLSQILGNLLTNAVKYTPNGGAVTLSARQDADGVHIAVADTGVGIPDTEQARVFEMFSQVSRSMGRAQGGLGIGLSLVKSLVEMHGGSVGVSSEGAGRGTVFTVTLPLSGDCGAEDVAADGIAHERRDAGWRPLRVVIADDNVDAASLLAALLQEDGHEALTVHDGAHALRTILERKPDLAILDIGMPGLNGYEVAEKVRAAPDTQAVVLVALTGWGGQHDRDRSQAAGFDAHLTKPAGMEDIRRLVAGTVGREANDG